MEQPRTDQPETDQAKRTRKTILVVDDEIQILCLISAMFADSEFDILTAHSGSEGLQRSRDFPGKVDLLLSDFKMPGGMSGLDLATTITLERPDLKVLLMSGFPGRMLVLNEGWHFLAKPFIGSQLRTLVSSLLDPNKKSRFSAAANAASGGL
jgi:DNA-binding NtrC family response regulator